MTPQQFGRLSELFNAARRLEPRQRSTWLDSACAGDAEMRGEVEALLAWDEVPVGPLERDDVPGRLAVEVAESMQRLPAAIGGYSIVGVIGEGGMGVVYEARQLEPPRPVALKVLRPGLVTRSLLQRFRHEAHVLGRLEHPGIARIYEAGTGDDSTGGQPFFAMELVRGKPLMDYAAAARLGTRDRLLLVAAICDAVHHAHQKGIIHRDLKPANVLVEPSGQPKVLDFGIARATDADVQTMTVQTDLGQIVGTVPYMSPEQTSGDSSSIDIRSDVYSLGVIAFELLAGKLPYPVKDRTILEAARVIREDEPSRLSTVSRAFRGDIETIVAKALDKDPARRYQSAADLAADIRRFLADEPIVARPASTIYQLRKFARRNRAIVGGVAVAFAVLVVALVAVTVFAVGQARAQREASREAAIAGGVNAVLQEMLASANPSHAAEDRDAGRDVTVAEVLDRSAAALDDAFTGLPAVEAAVRVTLGVTYRDLGRFEASQTQLERAVELYRAAGDDDDGLATAEVQLGDTLLRLGRFGEAESLARAVIARRQPVNDDDDESVLRALNQLGSALEEMDRLEEAEVVARTVLERRRRVNGPDALLTVGAANNLAIIYRAMRRYDDAEKLYDEVLAHHRAMFGDRHPFTLRTMNNLGLLYGNQGRYEEAAALHRQVLEARREVLGENHHDTNGSRNNLALALRQLGRAEEAIALWEPVVEHLVATVGERHSDTLTTMYNLGCAYESVGRDEEALSLIERAHAGRLEVLGPEHRRTNSTRCKLADLYVKLGRYAEAEPLMRHCYECYAQASPGDTFAGRAASHMADLYDAWGRPDEAAEWRARVAELEPP